MPLAFDPGNRASASDDTMGENGRRWSNMLGDIFTTVTQCRVVNESDVVGDLAALADGATSQNLATRYLKDVMLTLRTIALSKI